jgi:hypothetical protein
MMREMTPINYYMIGMSDHSAWLFADRPEEGPADWANNWLEWHQEMKICFNFQAVNYTCNVQYHGNRIKFYDDRPVDIVECPNKKCGMYLSVSQAMLKDLRKYSCAECGTKLG